MTKPGNISYAARTKRFRLLIGAFIRSQWAHFFLFVVVNIFVGSLGVWMPVLLAGVRHEVDYIPSVMRQLEAGGPYTFAVAYLAAAASFVVSEYLSGASTGGRKLKTVFALFAFVLVILCTLLSASQASGGQQIESPSASTEASAPGGPHGSSGLDWGAVDPAGRLQLQLTGLAVLVGLILFILAQSSTEDMRGEIEQIDARMKREAAELQAGANKLGPAASGIKV